MVRGEMQKPLFKRSMRLHRGVERVFADAKGRRGLARLHLRGLRGAEEEFLLGRGYRQSRAAGPPRRSADAHAQTAASP